MSMHVPLKQVAEHVQTPEDPHTQNMVDLHDQLVRIRIQMSPKDIEILRDFINGRTFAEICTDRRTTRPTIRKILKKELSKRFLTVLQAIKQHNDGPSEQQRAALLWRIALNTEQTNPRIAVSAVDVLNKQFGVYKFEMDPQDTRPVVNIQNFVVNQRQEKEKEVSSAPIEGKFTPVTVKTDE